MYLRELEIDGFGAWSGLRLDAFEPGLNVVYGPNEAGKTTLLEFIRSMLYGFSADRRGRYFPPVHGGRPGGCIGLAAGEERFRLERHQVATSDGQFEERLALTQADGQELSAARLDELLGGVDEPTFNNVFAVGLREMQELGTLNDTAAAQLLYNLTTGLDRVSLGQVMQELETSRKRLYDPRGGDSQLARLLTQRARLQAELATLGDATGRYAAAIGQRESLEQDIARLEAEIVELKDTASLLEVALPLRDQWSRRASLEQQLAAAGPLVSMPANGLERLECLNQKIAARRRGLRKLKSRRRKLREDGRKLPLNRPLLRQAARIQAMADQQEWLSGLQRQTTALGDDVAAIEIQIEAQRVRLGVGEETSADLLRSLSVRSLAPLKPLARAVRDSHRALAKARQQNAGGRDTAETLGKQIQAGLTEQPNRDLLASVEKAGQLVSLLRRRVQLDQRLEQMAAHQEDLEEQSTQLVDRQLLPLWSVVALGAVFVLGVVLILAGWWLSFGWAVAVLGVAGILGSVVMKYHLEHSAEQQLASCDKQLNMLRAQMEQVRQERQQLDAELPRGGGPLLARLEAAEDELARLEDLLPLDAQRKAAVQDTAAAEQRLEQAEAGHRESLRRWRQALHSAGWPAKFSPKQVWNLAGRCRQLRELYRRLQQRQDEYKQAQAALAAFGERLEQLLADVGLMPAEAGPVAQLKQLRRELSEQEALQRQRQELLRRDRQLRRRQARLLRSGRRLLQQRSQCLQQIGALDEADFRRRFEEHTRVAQLRSAREDLERQILATLGPRYSEDVVRRRLEELGEGSLEQHCERYAAQLQDRELALRERFEQRGQLQAQLAGMLEDRRLGQRQLELSMVDERLRTATERWQVLSLTRSTLESVRQLYERDRQPQTLCEASRHLEQLTGGRYQKVWTPMDEDVLYVDDAQGHSLRVEVLSRGTREQLFLSLRLALVASFARRGVRLPLVLDDVFVNFDGRRTEAAARLLNDFAAEGHQLLVFTCHEHIARLFESLPAAVRPLPSRFAEELEWRPVRPTATARDAEPKIEIKPEPVQSVASTIAAPLRPASKLRPSEDEALFANYEGEFPISSEPFDGWRPPRPASWELVEQPWPVAETEPARPVAAALFEEPEIPDEEPPPPRVDDERLWKAEGAEEFAGEFAERPAPPPEPEASAPKSWRKSAKGSRRRKRSSPPAGEADAEAA